MGRTAFFLRTFNDIDHITPLIWYFIQKKEEPFIIFLSSFPYEKNYHIQYLLNSGKVEIIKHPDEDFERYAMQLGTTSKRSIFQRIQNKIYNRKRNTRSIIGKLHRLWFFECSKEIEILKSNDIKAVVFEWNSPTGRGELLERYFYSAKGIGIPTFSIPHGCNIYLNSDIHEGYVEEVIKGRIPNFTDRNEFDYYVVQSPYHREHMIRFGTDSSKVYSWGSLRYCPEWQKRHLEICGKFVSQKKTGDRLKVVFMLPHWNYNVSKEKTLNLIESLTQLSWIYLVIKDHTRGDVGLLPNSLRKKYQSIENIEVNTSANSPALIQWSDAVVNFGSSIGIEVLLQSKTLIHPSYLHTNTTIFDVTQAAILSDTQTQVIASLKQCHNGTLPPVPQKHVDILLKSIVYGGKDPHDVLDHHFRWIKDKQEVI